MIKMILKFFSCETRLKMLVCLLKKISGIITIAYFERMKFMMILSNTFFSCLEIKLWLKAIVTI